MAKKNDQTVKDLVKSFGGANFADILNRLWTTGISVQDLQKSLAQTSNGTNDPADIITRLINNGTATVEQIKAAPSLQVPGPDTGVQWPFDPNNHGPQGTIVAKHAEPLTTFLAARDTAALHDKNEAKMLPNQGQPLPTPPPPTPAPPSTAKNIVTQTVPGQPEPHKKPTTDAEVQQYEKEHYGDTLWVNTIPDLKALMATAAREEYTPERFLAELHNTPWWLQHKDTDRKWTETLATEPETARKKLENDGTTIKAYASTMGVTLSDEQVTQMANDNNRFGWDINALHSAVIGYSTIGGGGALGQSQAAVKGMGEDYFTPISDEDAFKYAQQIAKGEATTDTVRGNFMGVAKGMFAANPEIQKYIDEGHTPKQYFTPHINAAAQLLEVDPSTISLTDPKYNQIINHADAQGKIRPMTLTETNEFIKNKDEYWKTNNASTEVSSLLTSLGTTFGKLAI